MQVFWSCNGDPGMAVKNVTEQHKVVSEDHSDIGLIITATSCDGQDL